MGGRDIGREREAAWCVCARAAQLARLTERGELLELMRRFERMTGLARPKADARGCLQSGRVSQRRRGRFKHGEEVRKGDERGEGEGGDAEEEQRPREGLR